MFFYNLIFHISAGMLMDLFSNHLIPGECGCSLLRHYATSWKVVGLILDQVTGIFI
jgi:hypothetical protein